MMSDFRSDLDKLAEGQAAIKDQLDASVAAVVTPAPAAEVPPDPYPASPPQQPARVEARGLGRLISHAS